MLIECTISRVGATELVYAGAKHVFMPRPELTGDDRANVCEVSSSHAQSHFLAMPDFKQFEPKHPQGEVLTREVFTANKNMPTLKRLIKESNDIGLLRELIALEASSSKPREWAGEMLAKRLDELE